MGFGRGILLWLIGIPLPIIILLALFWRWREMTHARRPRMYWRRTKKALHRRRRGAFAFLELGLPRVEPHGPPRVLGFDPTRSCSSGEGCSVAVVAPIKQMEI